ncbi:MAG TPA: tetratricopeptide repeat protein [Thermoanaerobaculia bacterium]
MSAGGAGRRWRRQIFCGTALVLALVPCRAGASPAGSRDTGSLTASATPRELSEAERAAVDFAVDYLQKGPAAWWDRLAAGAPLRRLGRAEALDQIAARVGPADGATWRLLTPGRADPQRAMLGIEFPSGLYETLTLDLLNDNGWKLADLHTTIDPFNPGPVIPSSLRPAAPSAPPPSVPPDAAAPADPSPAVNPKDAAIPAYLPLVALGIAALALLLGALGAFLLGRSGNIVAVAASIVIALGIAGGALYWGWSLGGRRLAAAPAAGGVKAIGRGGLGALVQLRAILAAGTDRAEIEKQLTAATVDSQQHDVQSLWRAQYLLGEGDLNGVDAILRGFPNPAPYPLAELLRARLAFRRLRHEETGWLYQTALGRGHDDDGLHLEAAFASASTDAEDRAEGEFADMVNMGTRLAEPWYIAAQIAASQDRMDDAETFLRLAWKLEPAPRADLFRNPLLSFLVARPNIFPLFQLGVADEARVPPEGDRKPLTLPPGATAATCGQGLRLTVGTAELSVPGGALLAPVDAVVEDAGTWKRHSEAKALAALPTLKARATASGGGLQPQLLRIAEQAGRALAEQNRWSDLVDLTQPIAPKIENAPASLVRLRAQALHRLQRDDEARQLLVRLAKTDLASRRPSTGTLFDLAELFAASGEYDTAIKLLEKADSLLPEPRSLRRRRQLAMDRDLERSYESFRSEHFEVRYPKATGEHYARQVAWVLEQERTRLQHWIPPAAGKLIEVHLFPYKDFQTSFGGDIAVIGIFDGKMRVPFAEIRSLDPRLVAVLSHELAHALMAAATGGQAPHWLQEGLAQHIEMGTRQVNPLPDLARTGRALSFPTVDPILRGFAEERFVSLAYSEAEWAVAFIESRFGDKAIPHLLTAFAAGKTNEQVLKEVCGMTPAEFDRAFWAWGQSGPQVRALEARRYDVDYSRQEHQDHEAESPHAGLRPHPTAQPTVADAKRGRMVLWYAAYTRRTDGIKRILRPILQTYDGQSDAVRGSMASACGELSTQVGHVLADPEPWSSIDSDVNRALRDSYILIGNMGDACRTGRDAEARALIGQLNAALAKAAEHLAPYGLNP